MRVSVVGFGLLIFELVISVYIYPVNTHAGWMDVVFKWFAGAPPTSPASRRGRKERETNHAHICVCWSSFSTTSRETSRAISNEQLSYRWLIALDSRARERETHMRHVICCLHALHTRRTSCKRVRQGLPIVVFENLNDIVKIKKFVFVNNTFKQDALKILKKVTASFF